MTLNRSQIFVDAWALARTIARRQGKITAFHFRIALLTAWQKAKSAVKEAARQAQAQAVFDRTDAAMHRLKAAGLLTGVAMSPAVVPATFNQHRFAPWIGR
jgi:hypothetical protein